MRYVVILLLIASSTLAQDLGPPPPPPGPPKTDLAILKVADTHSPGDDPVPFSLIVTNYGPSYTGTGVVGQITVTDSVPAPGEIVVPPLPTGWTCDPPTPQSVTCIYDVPLAPGQSAVLPLSVKMPPGHRGTVTNCAEVKAGIFIGELDPANNSDCTCLDFKPCRDIQIDVSTGTLNGAPRSNGDAEVKWRLTSAPAASGAVLGDPILAVRASPWLNAASLTARWVAPVASNPNARGDYVYDLPFVVGPQWAGRSCTIAVSWASDNELQLGIVGQPPLAQSTGFGTGPNHHSTFTQLHGPFTATLIPVAGVNILRARVQNGDPGDAGSYAGPTGLLVIGSIECSCSQ